MAGCYKYSSKNEFTLWRVVTITKHRGGMGNISQTDC